MLIRKPLIFFTVAVAIVALFTVAPAVANGPDPCTNPTCSSFYPYEISDFNGFLGNETCKFFNPVGGPVVGGVCNTEPSFDAANPGGIWEVTVIGNDAGTPQQLILATPMGEEVDEEVLFDKPAYPTSGMNECDNYGDWKRVNFDAGQFLIFRKSPQGTQSTIPCSGCIKGVGDEGPGFQLCELEQGTNAFTHLKNFVINGDEGYVAIGWDNTYGDDDFTDLIVLMRKFPCAPAGAVVFQSCVNFFGDEKKEDDDVSFWVTRRGENGCIESMEACVDINCPLTEDGPPPKCIPITPDDLDPEYVSSGALSGQTCANEVVNVKSGSPFYLYQVVSGGYAFRACLDLGAGAWTDIGCCTHVGLCSSP